MFIFFREREEKVIELMGEWCNSNAQAELCRLLDNKHCTQSTDFSPLFVVPELVSCRSVSQNQAAGHDFISRHTLSLMILIMLDILSEPLLSPSGKTHPRSPTYTGRMRNNIARQKKIK